MLAVIEKVQDGYIARFERHPRHSTRQVWSLLTENDKLAQWFPELRIADFREGGSLKFAWNGTEDELTIAELKTYSVLEFTWWGDGVRFELDSEPDGCRLVLKRKIKTMTDHTPKDLTGWHVCLDVICALLDGKTVEPREEQFQEWYGKYVQAVAEQQ